MSAKEYVMWICQRAQHFLQRIAHLGAFNLTTKIRFQTKDAHPKTELLHNDPLATPHYGARAVACQQLPSSITRREVRAYTETREPDGMFCIDILQTASVTVLIKVKRRLLSGVFPKQPFLMEKILSTLNQILFYDACHYLEMNPDMEVKREPLV